VHFRKYRKITYFPALSGLCLPSFDFQKPAVPVSNQLKVGKQKQAQDGKRKQPLRRGKRGAGLTSAYSASCLCLIVCKACRHVL
jgi:hypothetical protein